MGANGEASTNDILSRVEQIEADLHEHRVFMQSNYVTRDMLDDRLEAMTAKIVAESTRTTRAVFDDALKSNREEMVSGVWRDDFRHMLEEIRDEDEKRREAEREAARAEIAKKVKASLRYTELIVKFVLPILTLISIAMNFWR